MKIKLSVQQLVTTGMLAAIAGVLMSFEFSIPMMPTFYKIDFGEIPTVIALFKLGPFSALCVELIKTLIKLFTVGSNSMYVGELYNMMGIFLFIFPIWIVYKKLGKTKKAAMIAMAANTPVRILFACLLNVFISLPLYAKAMGISVDTIIQSLQSVNPMIDDLSTFIILATIPFNLIKISLNFILGYLIYTKIKIITFK